MADTNMTSGSGIMDGLRRFFDGDIWYSFTRSPVTIVAAAITFLYFFMAAFGPLVAPHNPFDLASISLLDASLPPAWTCCRRSSTAAGSPC